MLLQVIDSAIVQSFGEAQARAAALSLNSVEATGEPSDISQGKQQYLANMTGPRHGVNATEIEVACSKVFAPRER